MVRIHGVVLENDRSGRKAERCRGIELVDDAGNLVGQVWFDSTNEIRLNLDPRIAVTLTAGGKDITRDMSPNKVGHYYIPEKPTTENSLESIERHKNKLIAEGTQFDKSMWGWKVKSYTYRTRSR
jgi:hypothetical protein